MSAPARRRTSTRRPTTRPERSGRSARTAGCPASARPSDRTGTARTCSAAGAGRRSGGTPSERTPPGAVGHAGEHSPLSGENDERLSIAPHWLSVPLVATRGQRADEGQDVEPDHRHRDDVLAARTHRAARHRAGRRTVRWPSVTHSGHWNPRTPRACTPDRSSVRSAGTRCRPRVRGGVSRSSPWLGRLAHRRSISIFCRTTGSVGRSKRSVVTAPIASTT